MISSLDSLFVFLLGLVIGSFLNVVIYRYNTGRGLNGRSRCLHCGKVLRWFNLLPVVSFVVQRARCAKCKAKLSWQYPLVELGTGILFFLVWRLGLRLPLTGLYLAAMAVLVVIFVYDLRHQIIPDPLAFAFIAIAALAAVLGGSLIPNALAGLGLAAFFWLLWLGSRGRAIGFGDGKLALGVGLLAGPELGISAIAIAFWSGAIVGVGLLWFSRRKSYTMKSALPFAPFIIWGLWLALFFNFNVFAFF